MDTEEHLVKIKLKEAAAQDALNAIREDGNQLSKRTILNQINLFRGQLKATGQTALFSKELVKLAAIEKKLLTGDMSEMLSSKTLFEEIENLTKPLTALEQAQRGLEEATIKVENGLVKAAEKAKGEFGDLFTELSDIENNLRVISDSASSTGDAMSDVAPSANTIKQIERLQRTLGVDDVIIKGQKNYLKTMEKITLQVAANNRLLAENALKRKNTLAIAKELSSLSGKNEAAEKARLRLVSEANELELKRLQTLETNLIAQIGEEGVTDKLLQTRQKIKGVQSDISAESENEFRIAQAGVKEQQQLLNLLTEETKLRQKIVGIENSKAKRDLELKRAETGDGLTKRDEINLAKKAQKELKANSDKLLKQEKAAINLKFDLMALGFKLEKMKIARLLKEKKIGNDEAKQMTATIDNALTAIGTAGTQSMVSTGIDPVTGIPGSTVTGGTPSTGVRGAALDAADAASADKEDQADAKIKRLEIELERESKRKLASDLGGITGTGMMARMDNEDATARLNKTLADNEQVVADGGEGMSDEELFQAKMDAAKSYAANFSKVAAGIAADMRSIGPEGELMAATLEAVSSTVETAIAAVAVMGSETASMAEKVGAGLAVAGSIVQGMAAMNKASSDAKIRGIDDEIAAEKARDGQSAASAGKIKALEAKKTAVARKAFEDEKKMKIAQTMISTAQGAIAAYTSLAVIPIVGPALGAAAAAMVISMGAKQLAMIKATSFSGGGSVGGGPSSISIGSKNNTVDLANGNNQGGELAYARGGEGQGQMDNFTPAFTGYKNRAAGGNTGFIVGEQGPELFVPEVPGNITPAGETADMRSAPNNINFTIQAVDASGVESLLTEQRANIIRMIREAANEQGEPFLERVSETLL